MNSFQKRSISLLRSKSLRPTISIFRGASSGNSPVHVKMAHALALTLHKNKIKLVYGGGTSGLMGEIARTLVCLSGPTSVHGIIPAPLLLYKQRMDKRIFQMRKFMAGRQSLKICIQGSD
jgi:predicted Rossmann-fold nucleotide-binding protein